MKRRGRPKLDQSDRTPSVNVHWRIPAKTYEHTHQRATDARMSVSDYVRRILLSHKIDKAL